MEILLRQLMEKYRCLVLCLMNPRPKQVTIDLKSWITPESMRFIINQADSIWIRDYAPFILRYDEENLLMVDAKYRTRDELQARKKDDFMGVKFAKMFDLPVRSIPLVLEGGNFISNGDGLLLTSAKTLQVNQEGKAAYSNPQLVSMFHDYLGVDGVFAVAPCRANLMVISICL